MRSRLVLAATLGLASAAAFGAPVHSLQAALGTLNPQGAVTLTPTATLTATPSASASPTLTATAPPLPPAPPTDAVPTLSPGMLSLLALGLVMVAVLVIRRL